MRGIPHWNDKLRTIFKEIFMRQFFENKLTFLAVSSLFTLAFCWNLGHQRTDMMNGHGLLVPEGAINVAHGATFPPDPWEDPAVRLAHGATFPPDPWEDPAVRAAMFAA